MSAGTTGHVIIAPDKFKGSLTAPQVAGHVAEGLRRACPGIPIVTLPVADGGDGTVDSVVANQGSGFRRVQAVVRGPTDRPVEASFAMRGTVAIIEAAQACGLRRLPGGTPAPLTATSYGAGQLISAAIRAGARSIVLGLGGVACTDGGAGLVQAIGVRLVDRSGAQLPPGGAALAHLDHLELPTTAGAHAGTVPPPGAHLQRAQNAEPARNPEPTGNPRPDGNPEPDGNPRPAGNPGRSVVPVPVLVASDVDNPLLGASGAAAVYAPQKGATPEEVAVLEMGLTRWAEVAEQALGRSYRDLPGAGAAGGLGFAALAFLGASMRPGIELLLDLLGFARHLHGARLVITGEGSLDAQTMRGKAPAGVARAAAAAEVPTVAVAGVVPLGAGELRRIGISAAYSLTSIEPDPRRCMADAGSLLEDLAEQIANEWLGASLPEADQP